MIQDQKDLALMKNKNAARKYRAKKKMLEENVYEQLHVVEMAKNKLELENAGLKAENNLLKSQL